MILFPNCKINLGLRVTGKRDDGYHNLETIFYPVPLKDVLEITPAYCYSSIKKDVDHYNGCQFVSTGLNIPGRAEDNLCVNAWQLLKKDFPELPPVRIHLHKAIPIGAGLGGGSSDGAFTLTLLNQEFQLGLDRQRLLDYALQLGSDCPFFILNTPCLATGRGEAMLPITLDLTGYWLAIVDSGIHISTKWAFARVLPSAREQTLEQLIRQPMTTWKETITNDFEQPIFEHYPQLAEIRNELYAMGAAYASMSGTGSAVAAIFSGKPDRFPPLLAQRFLMSL